MDSALTPEGRRQTCYCVCIEIAAYSGYLCGSLIPRPLECGLGMRISYTGCVVGVSLQ